MPPPSLTNLLEAGAPRWPNTAMDLMGIVSDFFPPSKTMRNEYMITFELQDHDLIKVRPRGLKARFFAARLEDLPPVRAVGDVILIRRCNVNMFQNAPLIKSNKGQTSVVLFPAPSIPEAAFKQAYASGEKSLDCICQPPHVSPTKAEQIHAIDLKADVGPLLERSGPANTVTTPSGVRPHNAGVPPPKKGKLGVIGDVAVNEFRDLVVQVVKKYHNQHNGNVELYVSDYTDHPKLFDYPSPYEKEDGHGHGAGRDGDEFDYTKFNIMPVRANEWPGPYGQKTLMVELHPPHAEFAYRKVDEGAFIMLQNVRIKMNRIEKLEGNIFPDNMYPDKVLVHILRGGGTGDVKRFLDELLQRKETYNKKLDHTAKAQPKKKDKKNKKNRKRKERLDEATDPSVSNADGSGSGPGNKNVRCKNEQVGLSTLSQLLSFDRDYTGPAGHKQTLPFINQQRRAKVRVVDFWPPALEAFARPAVADTEGSDDETIHTSIEDRPSQRWEWDFFLLFEDVKSARQQPNEVPAQIWVHVDHADAQHLLAFDEDATDLYQNSETLAKLRSTLFLLWGNLDEAKTAARERNLPYPPRESEVGDESGKIPSLSNVPFECCIREYGQEVEPDDIEANESSRFVRLYSLFGTRILSS